MKKLIFQFSLVLFLSSCISYGPRVEHSIGKVENKVLEEFQKHRSADDFFGAAINYIEFDNCSQDNEKKQELTDDIISLYEKKIQDFDKEGKRLPQIEYTYSLINLIRNRVSDEKLEIYEAEINNYLRCFVDEELVGMGELERASWLMYLGYFTKELWVDRELVELFSKMGSPVLAQKFLDLMELKASSKPLDENLRADYEGLKKRVSFLFNEIKEKYVGTGKAVEETVKSSVKIIVDRGIKTEGGVGVPDQDLGTGIVIDPRGYILTNYHIIESSVDPTYEGYSRVYVIPGRDESVRFVARVVGYDRVYDLALLKIEKQMESFIRLGDSDALKQGDAVMAIGNPVGLTNTVTSGIVSSTDRQLLQIGNIVQIDAALNPGNSGGALITGDGYLIGIAFAGLKNYENLNFAIPSNHALSILHRLYKGGEVKRSWIGCSIGEDGKNLVVEYIVPNSPASVCQIEKGDIIKKVNGVEVSSIFDVQRIVSPMNSPMIINLTVERGKEEISKNVYLEERPVYPSVYIYEKDAEENIITPLFGMVLTQIEPSKKKSFVVSRTLYGSVASSAGIAEGDMIRLRGLKHDKEKKLFYLYIELKSKRFGYMNRNMVLYRYEDVNNFV
jgi:S1-C subfamily serine protease